MDSYLREAEAAARRHRNWTLWGWGMALVILGSLAWGFFAMNNPRKVGIGDGPPSVKDIAESPREYYGKTVAVAGMVEDVLGPNAFVLKGAGHEGGRRMLVIGSGPLTHGLDTSGRDGTSGIVLQVDGLVQVFDQSAMEKAHGLDLDATALVRWRGQPVLVARRISQAAWIPGEGAPGREAEGLSEGTGLRPQGGMAGGEPGNPDTTPARGR